MTIIGVMGGIGHGKTSFAEDLISIEPRSIFLELSTVISGSINEWQQNSYIVPVAHDLRQLNKWLAPLPAVLSELFSVKVDSSAFIISEKEIKQEPAMFAKLFEYVEQAASNPELLKTNISPENKADFRPILQWLGGYVQAKFPPGLWFKALMKQATEAATREYLMAVLSGVRYPADAKVIHDNKGYVVEIYRPTYKMIDRNDPTERAKDAIHPDIRVINDADLSALRSCAQKFLHDAKQNNLASKYIASNLS